ncbi:MAG: hypothetical protein LBT43_12065 [Prevotella sp.]|nr:hypothetical protein [Prevotella sp.]
MKSFKYIFYILLIVLGISSCKNDNDMPEFPTKYARITQKNITVKTAEKYNVTIHPVFDSEETAKEKFVWSISDGGLASLQSHSDNSVTIKGLTPGETTLKLESQDGSLKYFSTLNVMKAPDFEPVFIDFGPVLSPSPFNNFQRPRDGKLENLLTRDGENTGYSIEIVGSFNDFEIIRDIPNTLGFPSEVSNDMFFNDGIGVASAGFKLSNLNKNFKYSFIFYSAINDNGTENEYIVEGQNQGSTTLSTAHNQSGIAMIKNIVPDSEGNIHITLQAGPNNTQWAKFYNINSMIIISEYDELAFPLKFE